VRCYPLCAGLSLATLIAAERAAAEPGAQPPAAGTTSEPGARAARARVVILRAAGDDDLLREAATRLHAELGAAGFDVVQIERPGGAAAPGAIRAAMEQAARDTGAFAAATASRSGAGATVDLWIVDRVTDKTVIRTLGSGGTSAPTVIAVRAVELLQASLLEANDPARAAAAAGTGAADGGDGAPPPAGRLPEDVARWMASRPGAPPPSTPPQTALLEGVAMEAGLTLLQSADGVGPAASPFLRLSIGTRTRTRTRTRIDPRLPERDDAGAGVLAGRLTLAGPTFAPALSGSAGSISVRQELAAFELVYAPTATATLVPLFSAGAGAYHLHAVGDPRPPFQSASGDVWALVVGAGAGLGLRINDRAAALLDLQMLLTQPRPVIQLAGETLGSAGRPTFAGFLGLVARL